MFATTGMWYENTCDSVWGQSQILLPLLTLIPPSYQKERMTFRRGYGKQKCVFFVIWMSGPQVKSTYFGQIKSEGSRCLSLPCACPLAPPPSSLWTALLITIFTISSNSHWAWMTKPFSATPFCSQPNGSRGLPATTEPVSKPSPQLSLMQTNGADLVWQVSLKTLVLCGCYWPLA